MKAHKMSNSPLRGKQNADVDHCDSTHAHTHAHAHQKKRKKNNHPFSVPTIFKKLYSWDDMHIIGYAFPKKNREKES